MKRIVVSVFCFSFFLSAYSEDDNPTSGARSSALANASVALSDVWSTSQNQAGLGFVRTVSGGAFYENKFLLKNLSLKSAAVALPVKGGTFGVLVSNYGYKLYSENKYGLSFAKSFKEKFSIGMSLDYLNTKIGEGYGSQNKLVAEIGILSKPFKKLTIGAHVYNPTRTKISSANNERIPTIFRLGGTYHFSDKVLLVIETAKDISQKIMFKAGIEYKPVSQFYIRGGISTYPTLSSFGFGVVLKNIHIDMAAHYNQELGVSPQFGLTYIHTKIQTTATSVH